MFGFDDTFTSKLMNFACVSSKKEVELNAP